MGHAENRRAAGDRRLNPGGLSFRAAFRVPSNPGVPNEAGFASLGWKRAFGLLGRSREESWFPPAKPKIPRLVLRSRARVALRSG